MSDRSRTKQGGKQGGTGQGWFRAVVALLGAVPVVVGAQVTATGASRFLAVEAPAGLDHQLRYLGGVYLGLGVAVWWVARRPADRGAVLAVACGAVFLGGVARLVSVADVGPASSVQYLFVAIEFAVVGLVIWHRYLWPPTRVSIGSASLDSSVAS